MSIQKNDHERTRAILKIERYFNETSDISFETIFRSIIQEKVEYIIYPSYHDEQPKKASSDEGVA